MTRIADVARILVMYSGAAASALTVTHVVASLAIAAVTVAVMIGLYALTH